MTARLGEAAVRDLVSTDLSSEALQQVIDQVYADIARLGGVGYPLRLSGAILDCYVEAGTDHESADSKSFIGAGPVIGSAKIVTTDTYLDEVSYTLDADDPADPVTISIDGQSADAQDTENLSDLAANNGALEDLSFYVVGEDGRLELPFEDADEPDRDGDGAKLAPQRVTWTFSADDPDRVAAHTFLTALGDDNVPEFERVRFAIARRFAGLILPIRDWESAIKRIAVSCIRIAVTDEAVRRQVIDGADASQTLDYLPYSEEYHDRLRQVFSLTGNYFA